MIITQTLKGVFKGGARFTRATPILCAQKRKYIEALEGAAAGTKYPAAAVLLVRLETCEADPRVQTDDVVRGIERDRDERPDNGQGVLTVTHVRRPAEALGRTTHAACDDASDCQRPSDMLRPLELAQPADQLVRPAEIALVDRVRDLLVELGDEINRHLHAAGFRQSDHPFLRIV
jgi:hypothetical protein